MMIAVGETKISPPFVSAPCAADEPSAWVRRCIVTAHALCEAEGQAWGDASRKDQDRYARAAALVTVRLQDAGM